MSDVRSAIPVLAHVQHVSVYRYDAPVTLGPHTVRLRPGRDAGERIRSYSLKISPEPLSFRWQQDPQGNWLARMLFGRRTSELRLQVELLVDMAPINPFDFLVEPDTELWPLVYADDLAQELRAFGRPDVAGPMMSALLRRWRLVAGGRTVDTLVRVNREIYERLHYAERPLGEVQSPEETLRLGTGSCRDSAWLLVQVLRHLGCAARFVSGYLLPIDVEGGSEATDGAGVGLHAWAEVYVPGAGWLGFDPASGVACGEAYLALAATAHYVNAAPVAGTSERSTTDAFFEFRVQRREE